MLKVKHNYLCNYIIKCSSDCVVVYIPKNDAHALLKYLHNECEKKQDINFFNVKTKPQ